MHQLGSLRGNGRVLVGKNEVGEVMYEVRVWRDQKGFSVANGSIEGPSDILFRIFNASNGAKLELSDRSGCLRFYVDRYSPGDDIADIIIRDPVPGF